jgi:hypothetical protein
MSWYRLECGLGRFSVVGTTVRKVALPENLLADEHHQTLDGQKIYIATTVKLRLSRPWLSQFLEEVDRLGHHG